MSAEVRPEVRKLWIAGRGPTLKLIAVALGSIVMQEPAKRSSGAVLDFNGSLEENVDLVDGQGSRLEGHRARR